MAHKLGSAMLGVLTAAMLLGALGAGPASGQANEPPVADVNARPLTARPGEVVTISGMGSSDADGTIVTYSWDFGDGSPGVSGPPTEAGQVYHRFEDEGTYTVTLVVIDDKGSESDPGSPGATIAITVGTGPSGVDGSALFEERCALCHTKLNVSARGLSVPELVEVMTTGIMRNKNNPLSDDEIEAIAFYIALDPAAEAPAPEPWGPPEDANVATLYRYACTGCHGAMGEGGIGPSLQVLTLSKGEMTRIVADGIGTMPGLSGELTDDQIASLASYAVRLQSPTATTTTTTIPTTTNGSKLYQSECAVCHGSYGTGDIGPSVQASRMTESETVTIISQGSGLMPGYADKLTQEQIANVATYSVGFQTGASTGIILPDSAGGTENKLGADVYQKTCSACHGSAGEGAMGPSLATSALDLEATSEVIADGLGGMPGFSSGLSPDELEAVAAYSVSFQGGGTDGAPTAGSAAGETPVAAATGEGAEIFASNCAVCHGAGGEGASAAPINVPFENEQLIEIIKVGIAEMPGFAGSLNDGQITVLANYVHALSAAVAPPSSATVAKTPDETIVAIQPSRYIEFDSTRSKVPITESVLLALALGSILVVIALVYWQVWYLRRSGGVSGDEPSGPTPHEAV